MRTEAYWIPGPWPGRLGIVSRPRGGDWLEGDVRAWREAGVDMVVSLLTPGEVSELGLEDEEARCQEAGLRFRSLPIPDRGIPSSRERIAELVGALTHALESDEGVVVHCRQGIGRSALLAASVLVSYGTGPADALQIIESVRGCPVPDTDGQREWVERFASDPARAPDRAQRDRPGRRRTAGGPSGVASPSSVRRGQSD